MTTTTLTLSDFLLARIAEDEEWLAEQSGHLEWCQECGFGQQPDSPYSLSRMTAECEAKRRIVAMALSVIASFGDWDAAEAKRLGGMKLWDDVTRRERGHAHELLEELAFPYADHPDFNPDWN